MKFQLSTLSSQDTHNWRGGTTTELFIYPPESSFKARNFTFRLSTATVETEASIFTPLPNISRTLMVLEGCMSLQHENHHSKQLKKFDVDQFEGNWTTKSIGKCVDFNLMTKGKTTGTLEVYTLSKNEKQTFFINNDFFCIYIYKGELSYDFDGETATITKGDLLSLSNFTVSEIELNPIKNSEVIICRIAH